MTSKELSTYNTLVSSNNSFCHALNNDLPLTLDNSIKFELIIYYLIINRRYIKKLSPKYQEILLLLIDTHNYIIENDRLIIEGKVLTLEELSSIVIQIEQIKKEITSNKIIHLTKPLVMHSREYEFSTENKIIQFSESTRLFYYSNVEKSMSFESTSKVDEETLPYINSTRHHFTTLVNDIVIHALENDLDNYNRKYLKVISIYLTLYPFTTYAKSKTDVPFEELNLPQGEIGIRKMSYDNQTITDVENRIRQLNFRENCLLREREKYELNFSIKENVLTKIEQELLEIDKERIELLLSLFLLRHSKEIYNETLLCYLSKSFEQGYIEINRFFANPIIKSFYIEDTKTCFHCSARLETLQNLFNPLELLKVSSDKSLKKEAPHE